MAKVLGVGDHMDLDDLAAHDREPEDQDLLPTPGHGSHGSVHQRRLQPPDAPGDLPGHASCTPHSPWPPPIHGGPLRSAHPIPLPHRDPAAPPPPPPAF